MLGVRTKDGRVLWPTGTFETVASDLELAWASRVLAATFDVLRGVVWERRSYPFRVFVDRLEEDRQAGGARRALAKLLGNSLYGKFGARPEREEWRVDPEARLEDGWEPLYGDGIPEPLSDLVVHRKVVSRPYYAMVHWAAYTTAAARVYLSTLASEADWRVAYCDTDSLLLTVGSPDLYVAKGGPLLGQLKHEGEFMRAEIRGPKVYRLWTRDEIARVRAKGIPRRLARDAWEDGQVAWDALSSSRSVLMGRPWVQRATRSISSLRTAKGWRVDDRGMVRPVRLGG
jgi:hypothetical protein